MTETGPIAKLMRLLVLVAVNDGDRERPDRGVAVGLLAAPIAAAVGILEPLYLLFDEVIVDVTHEISPSSDVHTWLVGR
jgi:hypothetical protein